MLERIAAWARPARVRVAYPGLWVRPDVYAIHGHYLDCHLTVPTLERLSVGAMSRVLGRPAAGFADVEDYEAVSAPVFAWRDAVARDGRTGDALNGVTMVGAWRALGGESAAELRGRGIVPASGERRRLAASTGTRALVAGFPLAVAALNRAGLGPLRAEISGGELRRAGPCGDGRGGGAARPRRRLRGLRPHPPRGTAAGRSRAGVARRPAGRSGRRGRTARERRLLDLRPGISHRQPRREPLLAGDVRARRGLRAARRSSACCWTAPTRSSGHPRREAGRQALHAGSASRSSVPAVWRSCSISG